MQHVTNSAIDRNQISRASRLSLGDPRGDGGLARVTASASTDELRSGQDVLPATIEAAS
jgi:hypothetical protein